MSQQIIYDFIELQNSRDVKIIPSSLEGRGRMSAEAGKISK